MSVPLGESSVIFFDQKDTGDNVIYFKRYDAPRTKKETDCCRSNETSSIVTAVVRSLYVDEWWGG